MPEPPLTYARKEKLVAAFNLTEATFVKLTITFAAHARDSKWFATPIISISFHVSDVCSSKWWNHTTTSGKSSCPIYAILVRITASPTGLLHQSDRTIKRRWSKWSCFWKSPKKFVIKKEKKIEWHTEREKRLFENQAVLNSDIFSVGAEHF